MTNKKLHKKFDVSRLLASIISSRDTIDILKEAIKKTDTDSVDLDFSNVRFISRSATHALLLMQERLQPKKDISFINTNKDVSDMLRIVAANRVVSKKRKPAFNPKKTNIKSLLKEVLA
jgi:anti-anti-sigma regulatory factor